MKSIQQFFREWYGGLSEVWQPGYTREYRVYRLREAFGLLPEQEHPFKVGDWVRCIDDRYWEDVLYYGEVYKVIGLQWLDEQSQVVLAGPTPNTWFAKRFEKV